MKNNEQEKIDLIKKSYEYKNQKKYKQAIEVLYKVLEFENNQDDTIELLSQIADLYAKINNLEKALDQYQKILSVAPDNEHCTQQCYDIYFKTNQLNKALKITTNMCEKFRSLKSYHNHIKTLIALDKKQDAIEFFNSLEETIKLDTDILYLIAQISEDKKEIILKRILDLDLNHNAANIELAKLEYEKRNYDKVVSYCLNADENNPEALYYLAKIESIRNNHFEAIELYKKAIELKPEACDFYIDLAKTYIDVSYFSQALVLLKKTINMLISKNNNNIIDEIYFLTGWIYIKQNESSKALLNLNSIKKDSIYYKDAQILIQTIDAKKLKISTAISKLEEFFEKEKNNSLLLDTLAFCYKELKMFDKAINIYQ